MIIVTLWVWTTAAVAQTPSPIPFPHPVITEVLYAVPSGLDAADPNGDGESDSTADEFVELVNPHLQSIDLAGYAIVDAIGLKDADDPRGVSFVFPAFTLAPGERVVVFNGHEDPDPARWGGPKEAPREANPAFVGAWTFSMGNTSRQTAFANARDLCALRAPDGTIVDVVVWGKEDEVRKLTPAGALRVGAAPANPGCSVQRRGAWAALEPHSAIDGRIFSPGQ